MSNRNVKIGTLLVNSAGQYTKVITHKRGLYGLSGWGTEKNAKEATVARVFLNRFGLSFGGARPVKGTPASVANAPATNEGGTANTPTKASIKKLSADEAKDFLKQETGEEVETGKEAKEKLEIHFGL